MRVTEAQFQRQVIDYAHLNGWKVLHVRKSMGRRDGEAAWQTTTNLRGWPDLFMWHEAMKRQLAAELKSDHGRVTPHQVDILASLALSGIESHLWTPSDWDAIETRLKWKRQRPRSASNAAKRST